MADVTEEEVTFGVDAPEDESPLAAKNNAAGGSIAAAIDDAAGKVLGVAALFRRRMRLGRGA